MSADMAGLEAAVAATAYGASGGYVAGGGGSIGAGGTIGRGGKGGSALKSLTGALAGWMGSTGSGSGGGTPTASPDDPCFALATAVKRVYEQERKEGVFDEAFLTAAFLAFVSCVFGRSHQFVYEDTASGSGGRGTPTAGGSGTAVGAPTSMNMRFAKDEWLRYASGRSPTLARLLDEVQHAQLLTAFAIDSHLRQVSMHLGIGGRTPAGMPVVMPPPQDAAAALRASNGAGVGCTVNLTDYLIAESMPVHGSVGAGHALAPHAAFAGGGYSASVGAAAAAAAAASAGGGGSIGARSLTSIGGGGTSGPGTVSAAASLLGPPPNFATIARKLYAALLATGVYDSMNDAQPPAGASDPSATGVAGTPHTVATALSSLAFAAGCASYTTGRSPSLPPHLPDPTPPVVITALRALLTAATSATLVPDESAYNIVHVAAAATHDPLLLPVVLGVLWARINDAADKHWQHGYKAMVLLYALLRVGSPRVHTLAIAFLPLLRFLMHPLRVLGVRSGYISEVRAVVEARRYIVVTTRECTRCLPSGFSAHVVYVCRSCRPSCLMRPLCSAPISRRRAAAVVASSAARACQARAASLPASRCCRRTPPTTRCKPSARSWVQL